MTLLPSRRPAAETSVVIEQREGAAVQRKTRSPGPARRPFLPPDARVTPGESAPASSIPGEERKLRMIWIYVWSSHITRVRINRVKVANLARGQLNRENDFFPVRVRA